MAQQSLHGIIPTVRDALDELTVDALKGLVRLLPTDNKATRKADLMTVIEQHLSGANLRAVWDKLDQTQQLAVAETLHSNRGVYEPERFRAKYDQAPELGGSRPDYEKAPSRLRLFLYQPGRYGKGELSIPADLALRLRAFVTRPAPPSIPCLDELPQEYECITKRYQWQEGDKGLTFVTPGGVYQVPTKKPTETITKERILLVRRDTERDALTEISVVLRMVDLGKLTVSDKTQLPGVASLRELAGVLSGGDFYPPGKVCPDTREEIGPIKAFAWLMLVQGGGLAELQGKKLGLTKTGRAALGKPPAETLRKLWQRWLKTRLFDEFNRVDAIKGQQGKGKRTMTAPAGRREVIHEALCDCAPGAWIKFDDLSRYLLAAGYDLEITRQPWDLYIVDAQYGSLGHQGYHGWHILQKRYLACLLFEYAATLGLIDVAYLDPWDMPRDFDKQWGGDSLSFLSRYDGLAWFRINPLGVYGLGLTDEYLPAVSTSQVTFMVLPNLQIRLASGALSTEEALFLETWTECEGGEAWRLERRKILTAAESGQKIGELRDFLEQRCAGELPDSVDHFLVTAARNAVALRDIGRVLLIECADQDIAELIAGHEQTRGLCQQAGPRHLTLRPEHEERFRKAVNGLGYGLPKG